MPPTVCFSTALKVLKSNPNAMIQRLGWNGKSLFVKMQRPDENSKMTLPYGMQRPDENSKMTLPYLYIEYPADHGIYPQARCPWLASQTDILSDDWLVFA